MKFYQKRGFALVVLVLTEWIARGTLDADTFAQYIGPHWEAYALAWALLFLVLYAACAAAWLLTRRNLRPGEEHGSARGGGAPPPAISCLIPCDFAPGLSLP